MQPTPKKVAPKHVFSEFFIEVSLFLNIEKNTKKGINEPHTNIKIKTTIGIFTIRMIKIIGN